MPDIATTAHPDDLLVLLEVARTGLFATAATNLAVNHTTVSRRIAALEKSLGGRVLSRTIGAWQLTELGHRAVTAAEKIESAVTLLTTAPVGSERLRGVVRLSATDGFSAYIATPAVTDLQRENPELRVEILTVTRQALQHRSGLDIEVVVGEPRVHRANSVRLGDYVLGMYASTAYLDEHGIPGSAEELVRHPLIYFIDSILQVDDLDAPRRLVPTMLDAFTSTNVFVHVEATRAGAGIGMLPCFMADRHADLVRLLPEHFRETLSYWMVVREESLLQPAVAAVAQALRSQTAAYRESLLGLPATRTGMATRMGMG